MDAEHSPSAQHTDMPRPLHWHLHFEHAQPRTSAQPHLLSQALALSLAASQYNPADMAFWFQAPPPLHKLATKLWRDDTFSYYHFR
nr:hypothetical protein Q903MT_gene5334 [Picea sitchensis]